MNPETPADATSDGTPTPDTTAAAQPGTKPEGNARGEPVESEDAALARIFGGGGTSAEAASTPAPDGQQAGEPAPKADAATAPNPKLEPALKALRRDGVPEAVLKNLTADQLLEWGSKRQTQQAEVDAYGAKLKDAEARAAKASAPQPESDPAAGGSGAASTQETDPEEALIGSLAETIGDDAAALVAKVIGERAKVATAAVAQAQAAAAAAQTRTESLIAAAETLAGYGKGLDATRDLLARMSELGTQHQGQFESVAALAQAAAKSLYGEPGAGRSGQPTAARPTPAPRALTDEEREDIALNACLAGKGADTARKLAGIR